MCSALDPDKGTELELTVYTLTVHDGGVNQGLCAESKMYIDDLRVKGGVILGRGWDEGLRPRPARATSKPETTSASGDGLCVGWCCGLVQHVGRPHPKKLSLAL